MNLKNDLYLQNHDFLIEIIEKSKTKTAENESNIS